MTDLSSEKIAKALKGAGLSSKQRIEAATDAWLNDDIFFPNKDDFLFEWLCTLLIRSNLKNPAETPLLNIAYWQLLNQLLEHYDARVKLDRKRTPPVIRAYLVLAISRVLQYLYTKLKDDVEKRTEMLTELDICVQLLFSNSFTYSYRPTFEHMAIIVDQIGTGLAIQIDLTKKDNSLEAKPMEKLAAISEIIFERYDSQIIQAGNPRKIYTSIVGGSFKTLLAIRRRVLTLENGQMYTGVSQRITDVLTNALFHTDTISEYVSLLKDAFVNGQYGRSTKQVSFVKSTFDELISMVAQSKDKEVLIDALDVIPTLFSSFVTGFRAKRESHISSTMQEVERTVEFGFFIEALAILKEAKERSPRVYLQSLGGLLKQLLQLNVYSARNDDITKSEQAVLNGIGDEMVIFLGDLEKYDQGLIFDVADTLLQTDLSFIEPRITSFWPGLLNPAKEAEESSLAFTKSVLQVYSVSRQLDVFVNDFLIAIDAIDFVDAYAVLAKPLFSREFLKEFSTAVNKHMPAAQALTIFERFSTRLYSAAKEVSQTPPAKKQKHSKTQKAERKPIARFIIVYLVEYVGALRLSQHQRRSFVKASKDLFEQFIQPSLEQWAESKSDIESTALPAIQIHFSLTNTLFDVYWKHLEEDQREWLANVLKQVFKDNIKKKTQSGRISVVTSVNALLQHAYFASLISENTPARQTSELVNTALEAVVDHKHGKEVTWDGSLVHLDSNKKVKLACWKLITDEWFDVVCRFVSNEHAEKIASIALLSLVQTPETEEYNPNVVTFQVLNKTLLRSANFYEAGCLKDHTIKTLVSEFTELFRTNILEKSSNQSEKFFARSIVKLSLNSGSPLNMSVQTIAELKEALETLDSMNEDVNEADTKCVDQIAMFMKLFSLFPNEYYDKYYLRQVMALSFYADAWVLSKKSADSGSRIKASLVCRNLQANLIGSQTNKCILIIDPSFLNWFVHSINELPVNDDQNVKRQLSFLKKLTLDTNKNVLSTVISIAGGRSNGATYSAYFEQILKLSIESLKKHDRVCTISPNIWVSSIMETLNNYLRNRASSLSHNKISVDINDTIYATKDISSIGSYVIKALGKTKEEISAMLELLQKIEDEDEQNKVIMAFTTEFTKANYIFVMAHLLQDYVHIIGTAAESVVDTVELSKKLVAVSSPFIQFMQVSLRPSTLLNPELKSEVLNMTTAFIAAFCMTLSRYQQIQTTKRVIAVIWFVYSMVSKSGDQASIDSLSTTFSAWIQTLSKEEYDVLIKSFIEQSEEETSYKDDTDRLHNHQVFLSLLKLVVLNSTDVQKSNLKKWIPKFVLKQSVIVGKTRSLNLLSQTISLLFNVTYDKEYSFSSFDMSLILSCLLQIASPNALERFGDQINKNIVHSLFDGCCDILTNILRNHRDGLVDVMPTFLGIIQSLLHCFKSTHLSLITKKRKANDKKNGTGASESLVAHGRTIALFAKFAPLDDSSAEKYARLLALIPQKNPSTQKSNGSGSLALWRTMPRYAPYILMEYFTIQSNPTMSIARPQIKALLTPSLYDILDLCTDADRSLIMTALDGPGKALFKTFFASWKETHKYTGQ